MLLIRCLSVLLLLSGCVAQENVPVESEGGILPVDGEIRLLRQLSDQIQETSGLAQQQALLWTINDSGDDAYLYALDSDYRVSRQVMVVNAENQDWEDLAQDQTHLYIADCGNNRGYRNTLQIYKVSWEQLLKKDSESVAAALLQFSYREKLPTDTGHDHNFDCEAIASVGDELWLFTKNRGDQKTALYRLDKQAAKQTLPASSEFDVQGLITAADYHPKLKMLVLLGYGKHVLFGRSFIWLVPVLGDKNLTPDWSRATYQQLSPYAQWEAVSWDRNSQSPRLILTTEKSPLLDVSIGELFVKLPQ